MFPVIYLRVGIFLPSINIPRCKLAKCIFSLLHQLLVIINACKIGNGLLVGWPIVGSKALKSVFHKSVKLLSDENKISLQIPLLPSIVY